VAAIGISATVQLGCYRGDFLELACDRQGRCAGATDSETAATEGTATGGTESSTGTTKTASGTVTSGTESSTESWSTGHLSSLDAYRLTTVSMVDPHVYYDLGGCGDRTELLNYAIAEEFKEGGNVNLMLLFDPADTGIKGSPMTLTEGECSFSPDGNTCWQKDAAVLVNASAQNSTELVCDVRRLETINPAYAMDPPNVSPTPCFTSPRGTVILPGLAEGLPPLVLYDAQIAASYVGEGPAVDGLKTGLITGFIPESAAREVMGLIAALPFNLWGSIAGGDGCQEDINNPIDDTDANPDPENPERGVQVYLNFAAQRVVWLD